MKFANLLSIELIMEGPMPQQALVTVIRPGWNEAFITQAIARPGYTTPSAGLLQWFDRCTDYVMDRLDYFNSPSQFDYDIDGESFFLCFFSQSVPAIISQLQLDRKFYSEGDVRKVSDLIFSRIPKTCQNSRRRARATLAILIDKEAISRLRLRVRIT